VTTFGIEPHSPGVFVVPQDRRGADAQGFDDLTASAKRYGPGFQVAAA
jgi:hypothetical protein